jgi:hypothetical protein
VDKRIEMVEKLKIDNIKYAINAFGFKHLGLWYFFV